MTDGPFKHMSREACQEVLDQLTEMGGKLLGVSINTEVAVREHVRDMAAAGINVEDPAVMMAIGRFLGMMAAQVGMFVLRKDMHPGVDNVTAERYFLKSLETVWHGYVELHAEVIRRLPEGVR